MPLSDIVNVNITRQTQAVSEPGFGTLLILDTFKNWNDLFKTYSNMTQVAKDFQPTQAAYIAAQDFFSQPFTTNPLYIGRRAVDEVSVSVETALANQMYTTTINGTDVTINSNTGVTDSVVTLDGVVTWTITFSADFINTLTSVTCSVNGVETATQAWDTDQATTIAAFAANIATAGGAAVTSASATGDVVTVVFAASTSAIVNNVLIVPTAGQPTAVLTQDGPLVSSNSIAYELNGVSQTPIVFGSDSVTTMNAWGTAIAATLNTGYVSPPGIASYTVTGTNNNILTIISNPNQAGVISDVVITLGSSQATAAIVNNTQPISAITIANKMATAIHALTVSLGVDSTDNGAGVYTVTANTPGVPYTISVSTDIVNVNNTLVSITQAVPQQAYTVSINGTNFTYQAPYNVSTSDQISLALVALINSPTYTELNGNVIANPIFGVVTATDQGNGTFQLASNNPSNTFQIQVNPPEAIQYQKGLIIGPYVPSNTASEDLINIQNVNDDWYAVACTDRTKSTVKNIAAWIETQTKLFGTASADATIINVASGSDTTSIAYLLQNAGYVRSFVLYNQDADEDYPECAWFGVCLPLTPGSETWAFKSLASVPYSDLDSNQENNAFSKNCNTYEYIGGVGITQQGKVAVGEYIDIVRGVDWLSATIQAYVYSTLVLNTKVPYTDAGIAAIESQLRKAIELGQNNNFIALTPPYMISVPLAANVPALDKANRVLNNVTFQATLVGAIQAIVINGTVSV